MHGRLIDEPKLLVGVLVSVNGSKVCYWCEIQGFFFVPVAGVDVPYNHRTIQITFQGYKKKKNPVHELSVNDCQICFIKTVACSQDAITRNFFFPPELD